LLERHCDGKAPALRGPVLYRSGDTTPLAPWLVAAPPQPPAELPSVRVDPEPPPPEAPRVAPPEFAVPAGPRPRVPGR
jgi:hypothetical protein